MGQKTNPTLLRLEKTNQHYKSCWFSDRFYASQLHNNYKTCQYIDKILYKTKKTRNLLYIKAGHKLNQGICFIPKKRIKRFLSWKNTRRGNQKPFLTFRVQKYNHRLALLYVLAQGRSRKDECSLVCPTKVDKVTLPQAFNPLAGKSPMQSWFEKRISAKKELHLQVKFNPPLKARCQEQAEVCTPRIGLEVLNSTNTTQPQPQILSPLTAALFYKHNYGKNPGGLHEQANVLHALKKNHHARMEQVLEMGKSRTFCKGNTFSQKGLPNLELGRQSARGLPEMQKARFSVKNVKSITNLMQTNVFKPTRICFVKASSITQNSQFLVQKIINSLKNRITFQRLRKQILWDISKSKYVKGVRVTLSGRVESKSKKAQKARVRSFQWGQTELHVLSSLVQFMKEDCITPFGKIGIKVWICYGI